MKSKNRRQKLLRIICAAGFVLLYGTAGASDCGQIGFGQTLVQSGIGLLMFGVGAYLGGLMH